MNISVILARIAQLKKGDKYMELIKKLKEAFVSVNGTKEKDNIISGNGCKTPPEEIASDKMVVSQNPDTGDVNIKKIIDDIEIAEINIENNGGQYKKPTVPEGSAETKGDRDN